MPDEGGADVRDIGMTLAEQLIGRHLNLTWEHHLITLDCLWLVGVAENTKSKQTATNGVVLSFLSELLRSVADTIVRLNEMGTQ